MSDLYDDSTGLDLPNISDLVKSVEDQFKNVPTSSSMTFDEASGPDNLEVLANSITGGFKGEVQVEALQTYPGLTIGESASHQDARPNGAIPEPVVTDLPAPPSTVSENPPETKTVMEIRTHPFLGTYVSEQLVAVGSEGWWAEVFGLSVKQGIEQLTPEQIIAAIDRNEEAIRRTKTQNQGLRVALEHHLSKMNMTERAKILDQQNEFKRRKKASSAEPTEKAKAVRKASIKVAGSQDEKTVKTFKNLGMSKAEVESELAGRNKLTESMQKTIDLVFSEVG